MDSPPEGPPPEVRSGPARADLSGLYQLGRTLGRGHFAVVRLARQVQTGQLVAVKMIDKTKLDVMAAGHLLQEVRCMRRVQHPNVVRLYEVIDTPSTLHLVMELAEGGDLYDYILRHEGGVAEAVARRHFAQIVRGVAHCHRLHVVHRDLKPENVVFFPQQGAVKLTDFGFSNLFQPGRMLQTSCGSLAYSAPEILLGEEYDAPAVDIWSLGVILYMLVCGVPPFQEANDSETLVMILDCRYSVPEHVSHDCRDLISRMLQKDPTRRASLAQIEAHGWLQGLDNPLLSPEPPPYWLSGALSPTSTRSGASECGDLLASRPPGQHQASPGPWQPSLSLSVRPAPPTEEPPGGRGLPALQQICEEEEEEEEDEDEEGDAEEKQEGADNQEVEDLDLDEDLGNFVVEEGDKTETGSQDSRRVISNQPVNHADGPLAPPPLAPASPPPEISLSCCPGQPEEEDEEEEVEPNNNTNKNKPPTPPPIPESDSCLSCGSASSPAPGGGRPGAEPSGKQHGVKLRQRLFQFPLCEKALAFNLPSTNKPKILPLAQYNCCHVL